MEEGETFNPPNLSVELYNLKQQYERLKDSHLKILNVNQNLEDKMLQNINRHETEKAHLLHNVSSLQAQVHELQNLNRRLTAENERFKLDISVAIQLLHCKPSSFSSYKYENLPPELQSKAKFHMQQELPKFSQPPEKNKGKVIRVPISAFPSTTVIYSVPDDDEKDEYDNMSKTDEVSASIMAKVLEERLRETSNQFPINGYSRPSAGSLHPSRSMPFLDGMHHVDHGTQTYPNFIGEREKTRNTCIYCQGTPSIPMTQHQSLQSSNGIKPPAEPQVFVYTETETNPMIPRSNNSLRSVANRRKLNSDYKTNQCGSIETDI